MSEDLVLSDVHVETCPPGPKLWSTTFQTLKTDFLGSPHQRQEDEEAAQDEDGDMIVPRRRKTQTMSKLLKHWYCTGSKYSDSAYCLPSTLRVSGVMLDSSKTCFDLV
jgi:hypothetical protein